MKTTLEIQDELIRRAKRYAKRTGRPLRAVVEEGLRDVLSDTPRSKRYELPDYSVGDPSASDPSKRGPGKTFGTRFTRSARLGDCG